MASFTMPLKVIIFESYNFNIWIENLRVYFTVLGTNLQIKYIYLKNENITPHYSFIKYYR